ncbi:MAG: hypothetical protein U5K30_03100 [Acidimicrobiales bacterium]|nr:hypothetical protein [Acidimicrobiales bacterium]
MDLREWVEAIVDLLEQIDDAMVLLHVSLAMGRFFRPKSDVDLLVGSLRRDPLVVGVPRPEMAMATSATLGPVAVTCRPTGGERRP